MSLIEFYEKIGLFFDEIDSIKIEYKKYSKIMRTKLTKKIREHPSHIGQRLFISTGNVFFDKNFGDYLNKIENVKFDGEISIEGGYNKSLNLYNLDLEDKFIHITIFNKSKETILDEYFFCNDSIKELVNSTVFSLEQKILVKIFGEDLGLILGDEMGNISYILTQNQKFHELNIKKIVKGAEIISKLNSDDSTVNPGIIQQNSHNHNVFHDTFNMSNKLGLLLNLYIRGVSENNIKRLYNENIIMNKSFISISKKHFKLINFNTLNSDNINSIGKMIKEKFFFLYLIPIKKTHREKELLKSNFNMEGSFAKKEDIEIIARFNKIYDSIFERNLNNNSLDNFNLMFNYYLEKYKDINFYSKKSLKNTEILKLFKEYTKNIQKEITNDSFKDSFELLMLLLNNLEDINIKKIDETLQYGFKDILNLKGIIHSDFNKKYSEKSLFGKHSTSNINNEIIFQNKKIILKNPIIIDALYSKLKLKKIDKNIGIEIFKEYILAAKDYNDISYCFSDSFNGSLQKIQWYYLNINKDINIIKEFISRPKRKFEVTMYNKEHINETYRIHDHFEGKLPLDILKKIDNMFIKKSKEIGTHDTYMDVLLLSDKKHREVIIKSIEKYNDITSVYKLLNKVSLIRSNYKTLEKLLIKNKGFEKIINKLNGYITEINKGDFSYIDIFNKDKTSIQNSIINDISKNKKETININNTKNNLSKNGIDYFDIISKTFNGDLQFLSKLKNLNKNIVASDKQIKSDIYFKTTDGYITGLERIKQLLGNKNNYGLAHKPGLMFKYINQNHKGLIYSIKSGKEFLDQNIIKKILYKFEIKKDLLFDFTIKLENHLNQEYWCAGDYSKCCMGYLSKKQQTYIWDKGFNIVNIYYKNKVIANSLIFISYINGERTLVLDSFEINNNFKDLSHLFKDHYIKYMHSLKGVNFCKKVLLSGYNFYFINGNKHDDSYNYVNNQKLNIDKIDPNKVKPLGINYFNLPIKEKYGFENISLNYDLKSIFGRFKEYCYSDINLNLYIYL